jgi:hypothetical protein
MAVELPLEPLLAPPENAAPAIIIMFPPLAELDPVPIVVVEPPLAVMSVPDTIDKSTAFRLKLPLILMLPVLKKLATPDTPAPLMFKVPPISFTVTLVIVPRVSDVDPLLIFTTFVSFAGPMAFNVVTVL